MDFKIKPSTLTGSIATPPSKSHTLRAILFASLAQGKSVIRNYLHSPDTEAMVRACQALGAIIQITPEQLIILGTAGCPQTPSTVIDAGNSGQVFRFIAAVAALTPGYTVITGDHSIRTNRPIQPLLHALTQLNVFAVSTQGNDRAPILIKGMLNGGAATLDGQDSQPVSALLIASAFAKKPTVIQVQNPGEKPWIDLTLSWFSRLGIAYSRQDYTRYELPGYAAYSGFEYTVPGDFSSCAFPLMGALITASSVTLENLDMEDMQGDKAVLSVLENLGARFAIDGPQKKVLVDAPCTLQGKTIDVNNFIDAVPILAVLGCFTQHEIHLTGAGIARRKESDRLAAITQELKKMGAHITEWEDGLTIIPTKLHGAVVNSHNDHRIAMALAVAGLAAAGETVVKGVECVDKSYPDFFVAMQKLGAKISF